jgi:hypothetical protein
VAWYFQYIPGKDFADEENEAQWGYVTHPSHILNQNRARILTQEFSNPDLLLTTTQPLYSNVRVAFNQTAVEDLLSNYNL